MSSVNENRNAILIAIVAQARSGAPEQAWRLFRESGLDKVRDDAAVLSVHGRLLKDRGRARRGIESRKLYLKSAQAYARAAALSNALYPLINAATLSLLGGRALKASRLAQTILEKSASRHKERDTPYWEAATVAEALLLLGRTAEASSKLKDAIRLAPRAYEDHASTIRQFSLVLAARHERRDWLDALRPPRCLHFAGHIALADERATIRDIQNWIAKNRIGTAFGALAAGGDLLIAEALLDAGAELDVVLPVDPAEFRARSVAPYGRQWTRRFDKALSEAARIRVVGTGSGAWSPLAIRLAAEVAMGSALMQAEVLATEAVQLLVLGRSERTDTTARMSDVLRNTWERGKHSQSIISGSARRMIPRGYSRKDSSTSCLCALLRIEVPDADAFKLSRTVLPAIRRLSTRYARPTVAPRWTGEAVIVGFDSLPAAAKTALAILKALRASNELRVAGHYGVTTRASDPFGGGTFVIGPEANLLIQLSRSTPVGAIHVSEDFATALALDPIGFKMRTELVGEFQEVPAHEPMKLFSLRH